LDNGYIHLAAARMSVFRSDLDWAIVLETFGFSSRAGQPGTQISTFSNNLRNRNTESDYVSKEAYQLYLKTNPYNESKFIFPIANDDWQDPDNPEVTNPGGKCQLRSILVELPSPEEYRKYDIHLQGETPLTFEFSRYLAAIHRELVLANEEERRINVHPDMNQILQLEDWHHPDLADGELPGSTNTFSQIADVIVTGDVKKYHPRKAGNTHWKHWPVAGTL
jgi:hypothetical protein